LLATYAKVCLSFVSFQVLFEPTATQVDPRVAPLIRCVKHWAKKRGINQPFTGILKCQKQTHTTPPVDLIQMLVTGTLSSYAYSILVIHYLQVEAQPPVLPCLQTFNVPERMIDRVSHTLTACHRHIPQPWMTDT
jgi:hypothetical protein